MRTMDKTEHDQEYKTLYAYQPITNIAAIAIKTLKSKIIQAEKYYSPAALATALTYLKK